MTPTRSNLAKLIAARIGFDPGRHWRHLESVALKGVKLVNGLLR